MSSDENNPDVEQEPNQAVLEDDQIQATPQQKPNEQANVKQKQESRVDDQYHNPQPKSENVDTQQVDAEGTDLPFDFAQKLQQKQQ